MSIPIGNIPTRKTAKSEVTTTLPEIPKGFIRLPSLEGDSQIVAIRYILRFKESDNKGTACTLIYLTDGKSYNCALKLAELLHLLAEAQR